MMDEKDLPGLEITRRNHHGMLDTASNHRRDSVWHVGFRWICFNNGDSFRRSTPTYEKKDQACWIMKKTYQVWKLTA
jgi:hypothetical protein